MKFHSYRGQKTGVVIECGNNFTALKQYEDNSGMYTALLPYTVVHPRRFGHRSQWSRCQSGGYVVIYTNKENGQPYELLILDTPSIDEAVNVWR